MIYEMPPPAKAGVHHMIELDSRLRGNDSKSRILIDGKTFRSQ